jgi:hypothetical protein
MTSNSGPLRHPIAFVSNALKMLSTQSFLLIMLGFVCAITGALSRSYMWGRLRESGAALPRWSVADDLRAGELYFRFAREKRAPACPLVLTVVGLPAGFLLMVAAVLHRRMSQLSTTKGFGAWLTPGNSRAVSNAACRCPSVGEAVAAFRLECLLALSGHSRLP